MEIDKEVWIPIIGVFIANFNNNQWIILCDEWIKYQTMCCIILVLLGAIL